MGAFGRAILPNNREEGIFVNVHRIGKEEEGYL